MESVGKLEGALVKAQKVDVRGVLKKIKTECKLHPQIFHNKLQSYRNEFAHYPVPGYLQKRLKNFKSMDYFFLFIAWREGYAFMPWDMFLEVLTHNKNIKSLTGAIAATKKNYGMHYNARGGCIFIAIGAAIAAITEGAAAAAATAAATAAAVGTAVASSSVASAVVGGVVSSGVGLATDAIVKAIKK